MSSGEKILWHEAKYMADKIVEKLSPVCDICEIAGSVRRKKEWVGDIEIVCVPKPYETGIFQSGLAEAVSEWPCVKGELPSKYSKRVLPSGIHLDLFMCDEDNFGNIFLIRTGDWEFSAVFMSTIMNRVGLIQKDGYAWRGEKQISVRSEEELFKLVGVPFIEPERRNSETLFNLFK